MKKLLKYELRSILRQLLPLYIALIVLSIFATLFYGSNGLYQYLPDQMVQTLGLIGTLCYMAVLIAMGVVAVLAILRRFWHGVLGDEGYMLHMLPVATGKLVWSKLLGAGVTIALTTLAISLSFLIMMREEWADIFTFFYHSLFSDGMTAFSICMAIAGGTILCFVSSLQSVAQIYTAMCLGHLSNKHRFLVSFGAYVGISMFMTTVVSTISQICVSFHLIEPLALLADRINPDLFGHLIIWSCILVVSIMTTIYMLVSTYLVQHHLNLE